MAAVEHGEVDDDAAEDAALEEAEQQAADDEAGEAAGEADAGADEAPGGDEGRQVDAGAEALEQQVARHVDQDVGDVEDQQRHVEGRARRDAQVLGQPGQLGVADVAAVDEGEEPGEVSL